MDNLMYPLVGDAKLPRQLRLRNASGVLGANDRIALFGGEGCVRLRGGAVEEFQGDRNQIPAVF